MELKSRRAEVEALRAAVGARDDRIKILEGIVADQEKLVTLWKQAASERKDANAIDNRLQASYEASVTAYKQELDRVREERDDARRSRFTWGAIALIFGVVIGVVVAKD